MAWDELKDAISEVIETNGQGNITAIVLDAVLNLMTDTLGEFSSYRGYIDPTYAPGTPDGVQFFLASEKGVYSNFNGLEITENGLHVFDNNTGSWTVTKVLDTEKIYNRLHLSAKMIWFGEVGALSDQYNDTSGDLTVNWDKDLLVIVGNGKYQIIPSSSVILNSAYDFAYIDINLETGVSSGVLLGEWAGGESWDSPDENSIRVILFQRGGSALNRLAFSLLDETAFLKETALSNLTRLNYVESLMLDKTFSFPTVGLYLNGVWNGSGNWRSAIFDVVEGDKITYYTHATTGAHLVSFLDDVGDILTEVMSDAVDVSEVQKGDVLAPENAVQCVVSTFINYPDSYYSKNLMNVSDRILNIESKLPLDTKTIVIDKNATSDPENYIFNTIAEGLAVAVDSDVMYLHGNLGDPYLEQGLVLPKDLKLIGVGLPWIKGELPVDSTTALIDATSTIDSFYGNTIENILVTAKNMRYPMHADFSNGQATWSVQKCSFVHYGNTEAWQYRTDNGWTTPNAPEEVWRAMSAWGGGTKAGDRVNIDACYFESPMRAFSTHNNVNFDQTFGASVVKVKNSEMASHGVDFDGTNLSFLSSVHLQHLDSNTEDLVILENCVMNGYITNQLSGTNITQKLILNSTNQKQVWNLAGAAKLINEQWGDLDTTWFPIVKGEMRKMKNLHLGTLTKGKAVKLTGLGFEVYRNTDPIEDFFGVLMEDTTVNDSGYVKFAGYIPWKYMDNPNFTIAENADISVDVSGNFIQDSSHVVMKATDNNNCKFLSLA